MLDPSGQRFWDLCAGLLAFVAAALYFILDNETLVALPVIALALTLAMIGKRKGEE